MKSSISVAAYYLSTYPGVFDLEVQSNDPNVVHRVVKIIEERGPNRLSCEQEPAYA